MTPPAAARRQRSLADCAIAAFLSGAVRGVTGPPDCQAPIQPMENPRYAGLVEKQGRSVLVPGMLLRWKGFYRN
jgi:hypothetical protein